MHWKTKRKLLKAKKLYVTVLDRDLSKCYEIRIQIDKYEYVLIDLTDKFPEQITYLSLSNNGFNYDPQFDDPIIRYGKTRVLQILNNSLSSETINQETTNKVIELVTEMNHV